MYYPELRDLVGDEESFFSDHFAQRAYLNRGALATEAASILTLSDLDELLRLKAIRSPYVRIARAGASVREADFTCELDVSNQKITDAVNTESVHALLRGGATVTWASINHIRTNIRLLCAHLALRFGRPSDAIAFLTPAGREGFAPHHDPVDVFVIQLAGTKSWQIWDTPSARRPVVGHYTTEELGEPTINTSLAPGDVLYVPYGTPHVARAEDSMSLHLSITVEPTIIRDLLHSAVKKIIDSIDSSWDQVNPGMQTKSSQVYALETTLKALSSEMERLEAERLLESDISSDGEAIHEQCFITELGKIHDLGPASLLRCARDVRLSATQLAHEKSLVTVRRVNAGHPGDADTGALGESKITLPTALANSLENLAGSINPESLSQVMRGLSDFAALDTARKLIRAGILEVSSD